VKIPFHKVSFSEDEINIVTEAIQSGWWTMGPKTIEFENKFKDFIGSQFAVSTNSCTAALHLALKAVGIKEGDEVIIPTNTFVATAEVITYFNAIPVLCDINIRDHNIDSTKIQEIITSKTRAIIPVHFAGNPCSMEEIMVLAKKNNLFVIEDAAHALPSLYHERKIGNIGDITCFSFYATKTLSTGEGGMLTTNSKVYAKSSKINRLHGIDRDAWDRYSDNGDWYYKVVDSGYKYNMTDIQAGLGLCQLDKLEAMNLKREKVSEIYLKGLRHLPLIFLQSEKASRGSNHLFVIKTQNRDELYRFLKEKGIQTSVHFIPIHKHPYYKKTFKYQNRMYPVANDVFNSSLSLPIYPDMKIDEQNYIIDKIKLFFS